MSSSGTKLLPPMHLIWCQFAGSSLVDIVTKYKNMHIKVIYEGHASLLNEEYAAFVIKKSFLMQEKANFCQFSASVLLLLLLTFQFQCWLTRQFFKRTQTTDSSLSLSHSLIIPH